MNDKYAGIACKDLRDKVKVDLAGWSKLNLAKKWWIARKRTTNSVRYYVLVEQRNGRLATLHTLLMKPTPGKVVDHIDNDGLNNLPENLRLITVQGNSFNRTILTNSTGFKGVFVRDGRYRARITMDGKRINLGSFTTAEEAARAYDRAAKRLFKKLALTNKMLGLYDRETVHAS